MGDALLPYSALYYAQRYHVTGYCIPQPKVL